MSRLVRIEPGWRIGRTRHLFCGGFVPIWFSLLDGTQYQVYLPKSMIIICEHIGIVHAGDLSRNLLDAQQVDAFAGHFYDAVGSSQQIKALVTVRLGPVGRSEKSLLPGFLMVNPSTVIKSDTMVKASWFSMIVISALMTDLKICGFLR
jgi:hypothetical protein